MKFYNRETELAKLQQIQNYSLLSSQFTVLTGIRRVGKTMLYQEFSKKETRPTLYFFVARKEERLLCRDFIAEIKEKLSIFVPEGMLSFESVFEYLLTISEHTPFTLMIDEFQDFERVNVAVFSSMQNLWDKYKHKSRLNLIVCGSIFSLMTKIFTDAKEPLFGRADYTINLQPFNASTLKEILSDHFETWTNDDLLALYTTTGGIPRYVELILKEQTATSFQMNQMYETLISESSFFIDEGNTLLISEFGQKFDSYYSILSCIATGINTQSGIAQALDNPSIGGYIKNLLEKYEVISRIRPIGAATGTKKVKYQIKNLFLNFWFRYFDRHRSMIEIGNYEMLRAVVEKDYPVFSGLTLETYFKSELAQTKQYSEIGSWWHQKDGSDELDIVAVDSIHQTVLIAEVKRNPKKFEKEKFNRKVERLTNKLFQKYKVETRLLSIEDM